MEHGNIPTPSTKKARAPHGRCLVARIWKIFKRKSGASESADRIQKRKKPGKETCELTDEEKEFLPYVAGNYVKLKDEYLEEAE
jgi:hypothetical protein